jgi:hypothetical protein
VIIEPVEQRDRVLGRHDVLAHFAHCPSRCLPTPVPVVASA